MKNFLTSILGMLFLSILGSTVAGILYKQKLELMLSLDIALIAMLLFPAIIFLFLLYIIKITSDVITIRIFLGIWLLINGLDLANKIKVLFWGDIGTILKINENQKLSEQSLQFIFISLIICNFIFLLIPIIRGEIEIKKKLNSKKII